MARILLAGAGTRRKATADLGTRNHVITEYPNRVYGVAIGSKVETAPWEELNTR